MYPASWPNERLEVVIKPLSTDNANEYSRL